MAIGIDSVTLISIFVECILYGFFVFLFAVSTTIILGRRRNQGPGGDRLNKTLLAVSVTMFILSTVHVATDLRRLLDAFITHGSDPHGGPTGVLKNVSTVVYSIKSTAYCIQTLVGDGFMLYRLYLVWNGNRIVCFPIALTFIASIGVGIGALQGFARVSPDAPVFITELHDWIVSFFSLTLFTNFSSTALIAGRIWWVQHKIAGMTAGGKGRSSLGPAAVVIIESGAIYSFCLVLLLSLYLSGSYAQYILLDAVTQVVGIVFSLVIVRVALGVSSELHSSGSTAVSNLSKFTSTGPLSVFQTASTRDQTSTWQSGNTAYNTRGSNFMAVQVTKSTDTDTAIAMEPAKGSSYVKDWSEHGDQ